MTDTETVACWKKKLHKEVMDRIDYSRELSDAEVAELIDQVMFEQEKLQLCSLKVRKRVRKELFDALRRLDILQMFVEDTDITEIMINGTGHLFVERMGRLEELEQRFETREKLQDVIQQIMAGSNRCVNEASPIVDARLSNGARVNVVVEPVALDGPAVTIRRFPEKPITMEDLIRRESISCEAADFLKKLVRAGYNIFVSGSTGSGKTTLLNVLSGYIPKEQRIITIEDNAELQLQGIRNLVRLETRNAAMDGRYEITMRDLIKTSLRMRPDRIIVGEVRGAEAVDMIQAMNTGHDGSMCTGHANSAADMLFRLENMVLMGMDIPLPAIRQQLACGIDVVIHLGRMPDYSRKVMEIAEVDCVKNNEILLNPLYVYERNGSDEKGKIQGGLQRKGKLIHERKLEMAGNG